MNIFSEKRGGGRIYAKKQGRKGYGSGKESEVKEKGKVRRGWYGKAGTVDERRRKRRERNEKASGIGMGRGG